MRIELRGAGKRFGAVVALHPIDLVIPAGGRVALIGPNGSGKSTLTRLLMGLVRGDGEVLLDGRSPFRNRSEVAADLGYVPQIAPRLGATVAQVVEAVATLRDLDPSAVAALAARLDLDLAPVAGRPFRDLSGGMKQKLLLALALAPRPRLLILDEPTASLDAPARRRFLRLFAELVGTATVILCSHRIEEVERLADTVLALEQGRLVYHGPIAGYLDRHRPELDPVMQEEADAPMAP